jgi:hypothetical protein
MVGFTSNQTARLNVFNLNPVPTTTTTGTTTAQPANCTVALQFYDNKGGLVSQTTVANFAPGQTTSFDLPYSILTTESPVHAEIRAVVVINPTVTPAPTTTPGYCSVFTTLDVFDSVTGSTTAFTSDTRPIGQTGVFAVISPILR